MSHRSHHQAKYPHFKEGPGEYVKMAEDLNEAHLALYCMAVIVTEVERQNTHFPLVKNGDNNNIKEKEPDSKKHLIKNNHELSAKAHVTNEFLKGNCF